MPLPLMTRILGGGGAGDDDVGVNGAAARHCLPQTSRVVAATRLDLYSAFALWARATAGVRLEPQPYRNPIAEFGAAAEAVAPGSRPARQLERAEAMSFSSPPISPARLPARPQGPVCESVVAQDHEGWSCLQVPATTARPPSQPRRGRTQRPPPR